jgi:hypothetical protein
LQRPRTQYALIGAAVLALHAVIFWLLLAKVRMLAAPEVVQSLELLWLPTSPPPAALQEQPEKGTSQASRPSKRKPIERSPAEPKENPATPESSAIAPPIDWQAELAREAEAAASAKSDHPFREFDFPRRSPPAAKAPEFAWDRNHTHRVESVPGALLVHLNDNCVLVMAPLPFVFCRPGKRPANGDLFDHMRDSHNGVTGNAQ